MTRKASIMLLLASMAVSAVIIVVTVSSSVNRQRISAEKEAFETTTSTTPLLIGYCLKEYEGGLAVFRGTSDTPFKKFDVNIALMSDYDRILLHDGIFVQTEKELNSLIEDYTS